MLSHRLIQALPSRATRVAFASVTYLIFAAAVIASTLHRDEENTLKSEAESYQYVGQLAMNGLQFNAAEDAFRYSIDRIRACGVRADGENVGWYADAHENLADALAAQGRIDEAESNYRTAIHLYEVAGGPMSAECINPLSSLSELYAVAGRDSSAQACNTRIRELEANHARFAESEFANFRAAQRETEKHHPVNNLATADRLMEIGRLHVERGHPERAELEFMEAYELRLETLGFRDHRTVEARDALGQARAVLGKYAQARADLESVVDSNKRAFSGDGIYFLYELTLLGKIAMKCADYASADSHYLLAVESLENHLGHEHWYLASALEKLADCRMEMGQFSVARGLWERILAIHTRALGAQSYAVGVDLLQLAELEDRAGRSGFARANCSAALRTLKEAVGPRHPMTIEAQIYLSELWEDAAKPVDDSRAPRARDSRETAAPGRDSAPAEDESPLELPII